MGNAFGHAVLFLLGLIIAVHSGLLGGIHHFTPACLRSIEHTIDTGLNAIADPAVKDSVKLAVLSKRSGEQAWAKAG
ncbi:hypothetical protein RugamoR64_28540 [Duganella rhizosphaerae]